MGQMDEDPWPLIVSEMKEQVENLKIMNKEFLDVSGHGNKKEYQRLSIQMREEAGKLEYDIGGVWQCIKVVEESPEKFPDVTAEEIEGRKATAKEFQDAIDAVKAGVGAEEKRRGEKEIAKERAVKDQEKKMEREAIQDNQRFIQSQIDRQEEIMMAQDQGLDALADGLKHVGEKAKLINDELGKQDEMLDGLETAVDTLDNKLQAARKRVEFLIKNNKDGKKICCIVVLVLILVAILAVWWFVP